MSQLIDLESFLKLADDWDALDYQAKGALINAFHGGSRNFVSELRTSQRYRLLALLEKHFPNDALTEELVWLDPEYRTYKTAAGPSKSNKQERKP